MFSFPKCLLALVLGIACASAVARAEGNCAPPAGFKDTPHPPLAPMDQLVAHTEEIVYAQPMATVLKQAQQKALSQSIKKADSLPGVAGEFPLTSIPFGMPGARRLVCLTDGSTTEEQVLVQEQSAHAARFRYVVWNYTTEKARPILYGIGEFVWTDLGSGNTHVRWTYAFQLNRDRFPGFLGPLGDWLFRVTFLDRDYAQMMRRTLGKE